MISAWLDSIVDRMEWYDISLVKLSVLFSTLFVLTVWPAARAFLLGIAWYWYLGLAIVTVIPLLGKVFS